jgi:signal transduction histidine kinase
MKDWLRGKSGALVVFLLISVLVVGGLGWATAAALRLEQEQQAQQAQGKHAARVRLAMWRLDSSVAPFLAREDSRPFNHYSAIFSPPLAFNPNGGCWAAGEVLEPSPLLGEDLPEWMRLHFQASCEAGWLSPQVPSHALVNHFTCNKLQVPLGNVNEPRASLLATLAREFPPKHLLEQARAHTQATTLRETTLLVLRQNLEQANNRAQAQDEPAEQQEAAQDYINRLGQQSRRMKESNSASQLYARDAALNIVGRKVGNELWNHLRTTSRSQPVVVELSPMVSFWAENQKGNGASTTELVLLRLVRVEDQEVCQGILLDARVLADRLAEEVKDLFPQGKIVPVRACLAQGTVPAQPEQTMTALPFRLDPGPSPAPVLPSWTPLRVGLALAWVAALVALGAVGLGGTSLLDLSERRIRFISAVTHELRTPLTTFRLYLDMLVGGLVRDEKKREEYIHTLNREAERLHRLVANVLDFSRLERQRPQLRFAPVRVADLLTQLAASWQSRCNEAGKDLQIDNRLGAEETFSTDGDVVNQVLGNLIDNACKYTRDAPDHRLWVRARVEGSKVIFEVEDRGPGISPRERVTIFRPFRRGRVADATTGGVGLGLSLAHRWARLLGGRLSVHSPGAEGGSCFRLELPRRK